MTEPSAPNSPEQNYEVTPLESFFDLFAVSQLSHPLLTHQAWRGTAETLVMLLAILTVQSYASWVATILAIPGPAMTSARRSCAPGVIR